jgi:hypothetical protein
MPKQKKAQSKTAKALRAAVVKELRKEEYIATDGITDVINRTKNKKKVRVNDYLAVLIDPWNHPGAKLPDWITCPSTTVKLRQRWDVTTNNLGEFCCYVFPWPNSLILSTGLGGSSSYSWTTAGWEHAAKNTVIQANCSMARPVAMGIRLSYTGALLSAAGTMAAGLYDPKTTLPANYNDILTAPEYSEFSITSEAASMDVLWKPLSTGQSGEYKPVEQFNVPQGAVHAWFPTAAGVNTQVGVQSSWFFTPSAPQVGIRMSDCSVPAIVIGCKGLPVSTACLRLEVVVHLEATLQSATLSMGVMPPKTSSTVDPTAYLQAHNVVETLPVAHPTSDKPQFMDRVAGAVQKFGGFVEKGAKVAQTVAPIISMLL